MRSILVLFAAGLLSLPGHVVADEPITFSQAKKLVYQLDQGGRTLYCGCTFADKKVHWASCGYRPRKNVSRAKRTEIEHVMSAWQIGHNRLCWQKSICKDASGRSFKGRRCCARIDPLFQHAYTDLHNLFVTVGEVNGDRKNFRFAYWRQRPFQYGRCPSVADFKQRRFKPRYASRGVIARANLYMSKTYHIYLNTAQRRLFQSWNRHHPMTRWEKERNHKISVLMHRQ